MKEKELLEKIYPHLGGKENTGKYIWKNKSLIMSVKDQSLIEFTKLEKIDLFSEVYVVNGKVRFLISEKYGKELDMGKKKYEVLTDKIVDLLGGKENIKYFTHCITRLRFNVVNKDSVNLEEIEKLPGTLGAQWSGEQLQVIIGQAVADAYEMICRKHKIDMQKAVDEDLDSQKKFSFSKVIDGLSGSITPLVPLLMAGGFVKIVLLLGEMTGILTADSATYTVLSFVSDAAFYFLPVFVGGTAAKKFGANVGLGMLIGAMFIHPNFIAAVSQGTSLNVLGIPVYPASYTSTVFPALLSVWVMSYVQKYVAKFSPEYLRSMVEPFVTLMVMIPLALCVLGPIGAFLGTYISNAIVWLYETLGFLGIATFSALYPLLVMTGMHTSIFPYVINSFAVLGWEPISFTGTIIANLNQAAAAAAVAFKSKDTNVKSTASGCAITAAVAGVTEPALYGVNLKYKTPLYSAMIGSFVGSSIAGIGKAVAYAMTMTGGIFALPVYLPGGMSNVLWMVAGIVSGMIVTFALSVVWYKDEK